MIRGQCSDVNSQNCTEFPWRPVIKLLRISYESNGNIMDESSVKHFHTTAMEGNTQIKVEGIVTCGKYLVAYCYILIESEKQQFSL